MIDWNYVETKSEIDTSELDIMYFTSTNRTQITVWNAAKTIIKHVYYVKGKLDRVIAQ